MEYIKITGDELYHFGVPGMKWGHRKNNVGPVGRTIGTGVAKLHKTVGHIQRNSANAIQKDADSLRSQKEKMLLIKTKKGKQLFTEKDIDDSISALEAQAKSKLKKANSHERFANQLMSEKDQLIKRSKEEKAAKKAAKIKAMKDKPVKKNDPEMEKKVDDFFDGELTVKELKSRYSEYENLDELLSDW